MWISFPTLRVSHLDGSKGLYVNGSIVDCESWGIPSETHGSILKTGGLQQCKTLVTSGRARKFPFSSRGCGILEMQCVRRCLVRLPSPFWLIVENLFGNVGPSTPGIVHFFLTFGWDRVWKDVESRKCCFWFQNVHMVHGCLPLAG